MRAAESDRIVDRWARRYQGRRYIMDVPVYHPALGMQRDFLRFDVATRRVWHALRPDVLRLIRVLSRRSQHDRA